MVRLASGFLMVTVLCASLGCTLTSELVSKTTAWLPAQYPTRMVLVVNQTRMDENGSASHQGMLCRAYFFHEDDPVPVKPVGDLVFTAYDQSRQGENRPPEGLYEISEADLPNHLRPDIVGASYLFWFPYEPAQKTQMAIQGKLTLPNKQVVSSGVVALEMLPASVLNAPPPERPYYSRLIRREVPTTPAVVQASAVTVASPTAPAAPAAANPLTASPPATNGQPIVNASQWGPAPQTPQTVTPVPAP
jgi:hypothetical protein